MSYEGLWPRRGDELFAVSEDWENNACVGFTNEQWVGYIEGYKRAADQLVETIAETGRGRDFMIYPIVFLYRHAIELSLKHLIIKGCKLLDEEPGDLNRHPLVPLWQRCRRLVEEVWPEGPKQDLDAVGDVLKQFEGRDPKSTAFRYPVDTAGKPSQSTKEQISIRNFSEVANRVIALLDGCNCGIGQYLDYKWEMARDSFS